MKSAFETPEVKAVTAAALLWEGEHVGNIVTRYAAKSGGVTATLNVWRGPWADPAPFTTHGHAGGGGYDKRSAAIYYAARRLPQQHPCRVALVETEGRGWSTTRAKIEEAGYRVVEVIS
jgi:hypothetical protein